MFRKASEVISLTALLVSTWAFIINPVVTYICDTLPGIQLSRGK